MLRKGIMENMAEILQRIFFRMQYGVISNSYDDMMDEQKCKFLYNVVKEHKGTKSHIVEIGSYQACSTVWLGVAGKRSGYTSLTAIDLFTGTPSWNQKFDTYDTFMFRVKRNQLADFVTPIRGDSRQVVKGWNQSKKIAILHIDGDHSYEGVKADIANYVPLLEQDGTVIVDDYDSTHPDVQKAVHELLDSGGFQILDMVPEVKQGYGSIALKRSAS